MAARLAARGAAALDKHYRWWRSLEGKLKLVAAKWSRRQSEVVHGQPANRLGGPHGRGTVAPPRQVASNWTTRTSRLVICKSRRARRLRWPASVRHDLREWQAALAGGRLTGASVSPLAHDQRYLHFGSRQAAMIADQDRARRFSSPSVCISPQSSFISRTRSRRQRSASCWWCGAGAEPAVRPCTWACAGRHQAAWPRVCVRTPCRRHPPAGQACDVAEGGARARR